MKIKTRLSFQFTLLAAAILIFFSALVYYFSFTSQRSKFRENLLKRAKNTAVLLINIEEVDSTLLKKIHQSTLSWENEEIMLTDSVFRIIYSNNTIYLSEDNVKRHVSSSQPEFFTIKEKDCVSYSHNLKNKSFYVFVAAYDMARSENLSSLRRVLLWSILFSLWLSVYVSYLFSLRAIRPISEIITSIKKISASKLGNRLDEGARKDEIEQLSMTFNEMLTNLEISFRSQEEFVSNASHELRTPLAVMISETDYLLSNESDAGAMVHHLRKLLEDLKDLNLKANSLLELAHLNRNNLIVLNNVRIDEIIYNAILKIKSRFPDRKILSKVDYSENENDMVIRGNAGLLEIAFKNIIDNACKFSSDEVFVEIQNSGQLISITISDKGIGIPFDEINLVCQPFRRGTNAKYISGFGIGLSLVSKIIEIHNARMNISSNQNLGTKVEVTFNKNYLTL